MDAGSIAGVIRQVVGTGHHDVTTVYLFGSTARGTRRADSDVDVGVLVEGQPPRTIDGLKLDLQGELERALGHEVQLVVLNGAPPDLVHRVLRDGKLLLDRDPSKRIRFETNARREYFDVLP